MKNNIKKVLYSILIFTFFTSTSCVVITPTAHHDNGKHKGWKKKKRHNSPLIIIGEGNQGHKKGHGHHKGHKSNGKKKK